MFACSFLIAASLHVGLGDGWNTIHPGAKCEAGQWTVGAYYNSEFSPSVFGSYTLQSGNLFGEVGLVTGYSGFDFPVIPYLRAGLEFGNTKFFTAPAVAVIDGKTVIGAVFGVEQTVLTF